MEREVVKDIRGGIYNGCNTKMLLEPFINIEEKVAEFKSRKEQDKYDGIMNNIEVIDLTNDYELNTHLVPRKQRQDYSSFILNKAPTLHLTLNKFYLVSLLTLP